MSNYIKSTDFASKDALLTGNPLKTIKGTEIDDELNSIQTAVNTKADANDAELTGTPTAPTATAGTNTTQLATTAFAKALGDTKQPLDSDLTAIAGVSSNGLITRTGSGTAEARTITGSGAVTVTNGDGVSGNPSVAVTIASEAEAEAGTNNTKVMTPLRTADAIGALALGSGQTWTAVSRSLNTWYQNTSGRPIFVSITFRGRGNKVFVSTTASGGVQITGSTAAAEDQNARPNHSFIVPTGHYYRATGPYAIEYAAELK